MFWILTKLQSFFNACRWQLGVPHKFIDPIVQRLPFHRLSMVMLMFGLLITMPGFANQVGLNFTQDTLGALGDYEKPLSDNVDLNIDAQAQRGEALSVVSNASVLFHHEGVGLKPFVAYNKDDLGNIVDIGGVVNFSIGDWDISAGASFRGANPVADGGLDGFDADGNAIKYFTDDPSNTYTLSDINNINGVFQAGFEKWKVETGLTAYVPITERDSVPVVIISRSQTIIEIVEGLGLALVVDGRTYLHADGAEISFTPMGSVVYKF